MADTDTTPTTTDGLPDPLPVDWCKRCNKRGDTVPDIDPPVYHCNTCGKSWGNPLTPAERAAATAPADDPADVVQPDDVTSPGEQAGALEVHQEPPDFDEAMGTLPAIPTRIEWTDLAMQARMLSLSPLAPKILRGNPWACMDLAMTGRALGIDVHTAADLIDIIPDAGGNYNNPRFGRKSPSPELINARIQQLGLGSIRPLGRSARHCVAVALLPGGAIGPICERLGRHFIGSDKDWRDLGWDERPDPAPDGIACTCHGVLGHSEFTWDMAREAGLVQSAGADHAACEPGAHQPYPHAGRNSGTYTKCDCRTGYITYPERMCWWRAAGFCADDYFPAAGLGLYSPDALGEPVDADGRLIDPATIALPEGFEPAVDPATLPADDHLVDHLAARIAELPEPAKVELRQRWAEKQQEKRLHPLGSLQAGEVPLAHALVNGVVAKARGKEWKPTVPPDPDAWQPSSGAPAGQDGPAAPGGAPAGEQAPSGTGGAVQQQLVPAPAPTEPSEDALTKALAEVQPMTARQVDGRLSERAMATDGDANSRRRALAYALAMDYTTEAWQAEQPAPADTDTEGGQ